MRINQFKNEENNTRHELWKWTKKVKVTKQEECQVVSLMSLMVQMFSKQKTVFSSKMATNSTKRYFDIDGNVSSKQIYALLDDVESVDEDDIDNLMNDSDAEFIAEEEFTQAASTQDTSLTTPEANLCVIPSENQSVQERRK